MNQRQHIAARNTLKSTFASIGRLLLSNTQTTFTGKEMENPYQAPVNQAKPIKGEVDPETVKVLKQTKPWVLLMAILCFIGAGLMILGGVFLVVMGVTGPMGAEMGLIGGAYILFALIYAIPAIFLFKYSSAIAALGSVPNVSNLNTALTSQKSFWKFIGIGTIVFIALYFFVIFAAVFVGVTAQI